MRRTTPVLFRLRILGIVLLVAGLAVASVGFAYGVPTADRGLDSAQAMYEEQGVTLNYNDEGKLVDRGTEEGAQAILALLRDDWAYDVNMDNLDPADPVVNTRDELMYQYAVITYHVLHGERTVTLTEEDVPITFRGITYTEPGDYQIAPLAYYAQLDRSHPIEGQLRDAWSAQAIALTGALAAGHANQAVGELAMVTSIAVGSIGALVALAGGGLLWVGFARTEVQGVPAQDADEKEAPAASRPRAPHLPGPHRH